MSQLTSIGIGINEDRVAFAGLAGDQVVQLFVTRRQHSEDLGDLLRRALLEVSPHDMCRTTLTIAVGPHAARIKRAPALPQATAEERRRVVATDPGRFFLGDPDSFVTGGVRVDDAGTAWVAAFDRSYVAAAESLAAEGAYRRVLMVPSSVVLPSAWSGPHLRWNDGPLVADIECVDHGLMNVRVSLSSGALEEDHPTTGSTLDAAPVSYDVLDAYAAAAFTDVDWSEVGIRFSSAYTPWYARTAVPAALAIASMTLIALSPLFSVWRARTAEQAAARLTNSSDWVTMERMVADLANVEEVIHNVERFLSTGVDAHWLLGELAQHLPDDASLASIEVGTDGGTMVALTPSPASVLEALRRVPGILAVTPSGRDAREGAPGVSFSFQTMPRKLDGDGR